MIKYLNILNITKENILEIENNENIIMEYNNY
jgi:hypothetical protein